ncbi:MAG: hypothetical protein KDI03_14625 [Anaerolineae bacterium]|nr:hypothetical protein [Anaerolineae bacterium]MCB0201299.1 hypothetical protein [Anaerolineae bacterium]
MGLGGEVWNLAGQAMAAILLDVDAGQVVAIVQQAGSEFKLWAGCRLPLA